MSCPKHEEVMWKAGCPLHWAKDPDIARGWIDECDLCDAMGRMPPVPYTELLK